MKVILTNDDGIDSDGLIALTQMAERFFDQVWVVAPASEASQIGHRVTTDLPIQIEKRGERRVAVYGTPADCTRVALRYLTSENPDWVWSGINHGANLGRHDIAISGTVAAVREAAFLGAKAMAVSHFLKPGFNLDWPKAIERVELAFSKIREVTTDFGEFWNVNLPHPDAGDREPKLVFCEPEKQALEVSFEEYTQGHLNYTGKYHERPREPGGDVDVCFGGDVAISKIEV